jgi:DNA modification methylase
MACLPDKSIDLILCDLLYGTTDCAWDKQLPMVELWEQYKRIIKDNGAILLFAQQPFIAKLINASGNLFRYQIVWEKAKSVGFLNANRMPLRTHEMILVFYRHLPVYNQVALGKPYVNKDRRRESSIYRFTHQAYARHNAGYRYPRDVIRFGMSAEDGRFHPTQKPLAMLRYLIKTHSHPGDIVLDCCCGSGSACIAAKQTGRNFIGIELDPTYAEIAHLRLNNL